MSNLAMNTKRQRENEKAESLELAEYLMLLSGTTKVNPRNTSYLSPHVFECKTCNRKFSSFQALGGHRASHKKPKLDSGEELKLEAEPLSLGNNKGSKMHECFICGKKFDLGQALGGHMRKHRSAAMDDGLSGSAIKQLTVEKVPVLKRSNSKRVVCLDLNLTPLENDLKLLFGKMAPQVQLSLF